MKHDRVEWYFTDDLTFDTPKRFGDLKSSPTTGIPPGTRNCFLFLVPELNFICSCAMSLKISEAIVTWLLSSACVYAGTCVQADCCCKSKEFAKESSQPAQGKTTASFPLLLLPAWGVKKKKNSVGKPAPAYRPAERSAVRYLCRVETCHYLLVQ